MKFHLPAQLPSMQWLSLHKAHAGTGTSCCLVTQWAKHCTTTSTLGVKCKSSTLSTDLCTPTKAHTTQCMEVQCKLWNVHNTRLGNTTNSFQLSDWMNTHTIQLPAALLQDAFLQQHYYNNVEQMFSHCRAEAHNTAWINHRCKSMHVVTIRCINSIPIHVKQRLLITQYYYKYESNCRLEQQLTTIKSALQFTSIPGVYSFPTYSPICKLLVKDCELHVGRERAPICYHGAEQTTELESQKCQSINAAGHNEYH